MYNAASRLTQISRRFPVDELQRDFDALQTAFNSGTSTIHAGCSGALLSSATRLIATSRFRLAQLGDTG